MIPVAGEPDLRDEHSIGEALEALPDGGCAALISGVAGLALVRFDAQRQVVWARLLVDLGRLKEMRGDFAAALNDFPSNTCLAANYPITSLTDSLDPAAGLAFFYLVRESNPGCSAGAGKRTFDSGIHHQATPRDPTIALAMNRCFWASSLTAPKET